MIKFMSHGDVKVNHQDRRGNTAVLLAAKNGHLDVVRFLIEHDASLEKDNNEGNTPVIVAARNGHKEIVELAVITRVFDSMSMRSDLYISSPDRSKAGATSTGRT